MTPLEELKFPYHDISDVDIFIKRDDLVHPNFSGNKWRKLKYQIKAYHDQQKTSIITWGGALSNHLHAISFLVRDQNIPVVAIIPKDQVGSAAPSLSIAIANGLQIKAVSRSEFRSRFDPIYIKDLQAEYPAALLIPEGGSNPHMLEGVEEMAKECIKQCPDKIDYWLLPVGTGGTMLGILNTIDSGEVIGVSAVKGGHQTKWVNAHLPSGHLIKWSISQNYHLGGMGRYTSELIALINTFKSECNLPLDPIYTGKMMLGLSDLIRERVIKPKTTVVVIHTGGLIGIDNFKSKNPDTGLI